MNHDSRAMAEGLGDLFSDVPPLDAMAVFTSPRVPNCEPHHTDRSVYDE